MGLEKRCALSVNWRGRRRDISVVYPLQTRDVPLMSKADILTELPKLPLSERREILDCLCALEDKELTAVHQSWLDEALASGPARPATEADWKSALERGLARG